MKCGAFDESINYCEDWDLWLRYAKKYKIYFQKEALVYYRITSSGLSSMTNNILTSGINVINSNSELLDYDERKEIIDKSVCNLYLNACWRYLRDNLRCKAFKCSIQAIYIEPLNKECWKWLVRIFAN